MSGNRRLLKVHDGGEGGTLPQLVRFPCIARNPLTNQPNCDTSRDTSKDIFSEVDGFSHPTVSYPTLTHSGCGDTARIVGRWEGGPR